ncbi:MAG: SpoIID/LytB domain-containing protein [Myxococcota bacterium]
MAVLSRRHLLTGALLGTSFGRLAYGAPLYPRFRPLSLSELYAGRLRFKDREPAVSIGLGRGLSDVRVSSSMPLRLIFEEANLPKIEFVEGEIRLRPNALESGARRFWVQAERFDYGARPDAEASAKAWAKRGLRVSIQEKGVVMALRGNVLDTRHLRVWVGGFRRREDADALRDRLFAEEGRSSAIQVESVEHPRGTVDVMLGGRTLYRARGPVCVTTARTHNLSWGDGGVYRGDFYVVPDHHGGLSLVNSVGAERVLSGLVPAEMFASAPLEALKAQAVTARGALFAKLGQRHFDEPFHLCSDQHCQVYRGADGEAPRTDQAVAATRGLLPMRDIPSSDPAVELVPSLYSSTCGGYSEDNDAVWDQPADPSLRARIDGSPEDPELRPFAAGLNEDNIRAWVEAWPDTFESRSSFVRPDRYRWRRTMEAEALSGATADLEVGPVVRLEVLGRGSGGRVTGLRVVGLDGTKVILRELPVRKRFGLDSGMFVLNHVRDSDGNLLSVEFVGGGWGHGAGMCQMGAIGRAEAGQSFEEILAHYYSGARVMKIY